MTTPWYSTRLQVAQAVMQLLQLAPFLAGVYFALPAFKANEWLSSGAILFYLLTASVLIAIGLNAYAVYIKRPQTQKGKLPIPSIDFPTPDWLEHLTPVINKNYEKETVELDGKEFQHCEFKDVTFLYNGTKPTRFGDDCKRIGGFSFKSHNPLVLTTVRIVSTLKGEKPDIALFDGSPR